VVIVYALQNSSFINLDRGLAQELRRGVPQHVPILLENTEVGGVASLSITYAFIV